MLYLFFQQWRVEEGKSPKIKIVLIITKKKQKKNKNEMIEINFNPTIES